MKALLIIAATTITMVMLTGMITPITVINQLVSLLCNAKNTFSVIEMLSVA